MSFTVFVLVATARFFQNTIYLSIVLLGLHCCSGFLFFNCGKQGQLSSCVSGLLIAVASLVAQHWASGAAAPGSRAQAKQLRCFCLLAPRHVGFPRPGPEPVSPALVGGFCILSHQGGPKARFLSAQICCIYSFTHSRSIYWVHLHWLFTYSIVTSIPLQYQK